MKTKVLSLSTRSVAFLAALFVFVGAFSAYTFVLADDYQQKIDALKQENSQNQKKVSELSIQADSYAGAVADLERQIAGLQAQIAANEAQRDALQAEIKKAEEELARQRGVLGQNIRAMYLEGDISTFEMLASSRDLSEFVDKQQYRDAVKDKIKTTMDKITTLKLQLNEQKESVERLLTEQNTLKRQADANRAEQQRLLAFTEAQKTDFTNKIKDNNSKIAELRQQQILANARNSIGGRIGSPTNGYYPYEGWPFSMREGPGCVDGDGPDRWGYCTRQCVSYAAWAVERSGRRAPMYYGNANNWDDAGWRYVVDSPQPGDVAVDNSGTWGHVMYVEAVGTKNGRPAIYVSQYNASLRGEYSEEWKYSSGYIFLRFP